MDSRRLRTAKRDKISRGPLTSTASIALSAKPRLNCQQPQNWPVLKDETTYIQLRQTSTIMRLQSFASSSRSVLASARTVPRPVRFLSTTSRLSVPSHAVPPDSHTGKAQLDEAISDHAKEAEGKLTGVKEERPKGSADREFLRPTLRQLADAGSLCSSA